MVGFAPKGAAVPAIANGNQPKNDTRFAAIEQAHDAEQETQDVKAQRRSIRSTRSDENLRDSTNRSSYAPSVASRSSVALSTKSGNGRQRGTSMAPPVPQIPEQYATAKDAKIASWADGARASVAPSVSQASTDWRDDDTRSIASDARSMKTTSMMSAARKSQAPYRSRFGLFPKSSFHG